MRDMSEHEDFEARLPALFRRSTGEADPIALKLAVLERLEQADRRRRWVITAAAGLGAAVSAAVLVSARIGEAAAQLNAQVSAIELSSMAGAAPWLIAAMLIGSAAVLSGRMLREL